MKIRNAYRTGAALEWALDNPAKIEGFEDHLEQLAEDNYRHFTECLENITWAIDHSTCCRGIDYNPEALEIEHCWGIWLPQQRDGFELFTIPLSEELELQADNGDFVYHNIGHNFVAVYIPLEDEDQ